MQNSPNLVVRRIALDDLAPDPANARAHGEVNLDAIEGSLRRFGQAEPLVVQAGTNRVVAGHGRLAAMKRLGWSECDVVEVEVDDLQATALGIALNRTGELATWDEPVLARLLAELREAESLPNGSVYEGDSREAALMSLCAAEGLQGPSAGS